MPQLKLHGKPLCLRQPLPSTLAVKRFLDKSPSDELFTVSDLVSKCSLGPRTIRRSDVFGDEVLAGYSLKVGPVRYWGNPKAIAELKRQVG